MCRFCLQNLQKRTLLESGLDTFGNPLDYLIPKYP